MHVNSSLRRRRTAVSIGALIRRLLRKPIWITIRRRVIEHTLLVASWFIWVVSRSMVARLFARTHLHSRRSNMSSIARSAPHFWRFWSSIVTFCHARYTFSAAALEEFTKLASSEILPPLAREPIALLFGCRINCFISELRLRLQCLPIPSNTLYVRSTAMCFHLSSVIGYFTLQLLGVHVWR